MGCKGEGAICRTKKRVKRSAEEKVIRKLFLRGGEDGHEWQRTWNAVLVVILSRKKRALTEDKSKRLTVTPV